MTDVIGVTQMRDLRWPSCFVQKYAVLALIPVAKVVWLFESTKLSKLLNFRKIRQFTCSNFAKLSKSSLKPRPNLYFTTSSLWIY
jgi:hypothetical protein